MLNRVAYHRTGALRMALFSILAAVVLWVGQAHAVDEGWPRQKQQDGNTLVYYQPQLDSWKDQKELHGRIAVEVTLQGRKNPIAGAVWIKADTNTDLESRTVTLNDLEVEKTSFSVIDASLSSAAEKVVKAMIDRKTLVVSLDRILAGLRETELTTAKNINLKNDPPPIFVSFEPARLLIFDGEPVFAKIEGTNLQYAINTNWTVLNQEATSDYYLLDGTTWLFTDKLGNPWKLAKSLPGDVARLPADGNFKDALENAQGGQPQYSKPPKIFMETKAAELIVVDGKPKYKSAGPEGLDYVSNTDADLFYYRKDKSWYFLVAGRWYRASKSMEGPWSFATAELPTVFSLIPAGGPKGRVLYSVPGTPQAREAVRAAGIPQTATINPSDVKLNVAYSGDPKFEPIAGTTPPLLYAVNASVPVIKVSDLAYYACDRGIWFAASTPAGPWVVASSVPQAIYTIPPSSPLYPVTYVVQYKQSPSSDDVVASYTSGYTGCYISFGVSFWGTGYYYPPYWYYPPYGYPIYYPRPYTWGAYAWYNPATSTFYRGGGYYGPYGGYGAGASYNAATGTYRRGYGAYGPAGGYKVGHAYNSRTGAWATGAAAYGPNGSIRAAHGYNPKTGTSFSGAQGTSVYGSWGAGVVSKGDQWAKGAYRATGQGTVGGIRTSEGGGAIKGQNNTYVGKDGNVYRKNESGWSKFDNGSWNPVAPSRGTAASQLPAQPNSGNRVNTSDVTRDLNRQSADRVAGQQRASQWNQQYGQRSGAYGAPRSAPSYGGGMRGGGGRR